MTDNPTSPKKNTKGRKVFPALCNILGICILLISIVVALPLSLPRLLGYEAFNLDTTYLTSALERNSRDYYLDDLLEVREFKKFKKVSSKNKSSKKVKKSTEFKWRSTLQDSAVPFVAFILSCNPEPVNRFPIIL